ncbi:hypothetical protein AAZX31_18G037000 [Glycine max]|uniref:Uncharacterized protein n=2 Tax=Glycine subgen. Soja TaxID=1462606 RepID=C6T2Z3_SOYBN|nr:uncharacterized protein LOC100526995 [Glycine max]XP_028213513.1 uncharacterized protein LOC114395845 [Glycine soja]ACU16031.1 unknown [Glycine max]KAG4920327.1 hypothetical protein JHK86_049140 [Glycine max]KAG4934977.1 hypothetical protein JHK85_049896 [Glycine max]KAG5090506.1 hypothetical protein JHK82_049284 [Glycine max]KAG5093590.1 hypothetical protein JHK84_049178 [Glycine max]|eukprot:NP_001237028.1 uncharacterized protein LOC100526995 [Glycine max]
MASSNCAISTCTSGTTAGINNNTDQSTVPPIMYLSNSEKWNKLSKKEGRSSTTSSSSLMKNSSSSSSSSTQRKCAFARKCARLVKEQRARFYIMRRCVIMLICWHEYNDS